MIHADYITIPEGCIEDLVLAFRLDYELLNHHKPLDVLVVAGYNDLLKEHSRHFIMEGFKHLSQLVSNLGKDKHPLVKNSFAVSTLIYPPRLSWFPDNGPPPSYLNNYLEKINWLNKEIHQLNIANCVPDYPRFHTYGVRTDNTSQDRKKSHRWGHWEEQTRACKLHLKQERIYKMGEAINKYFALNTN